jgi:NADPH-dependent 2,4-dienoyl-CoA reductase/sulfur reductase-like enzyme
MGRWALSDPIIVVGAGITGLAAAADLAERADVRVLERLPAPGGTWEFDHPGVRALIDQCRSRGVRVECGDTALRWVDRRLLVIGPGRREWLPADHLVFAGGVRPATPAELPLFGSRTAGVFGATVAHHLLQAHVPLGRRIALCGTGFWADITIAHLPRGTELTVVGDGPAPTAPAGVSQTQWPDHHAVEVIGDDRVTGLVTEADGRRRTLPCEAVVLAGGLRPLRNVDGAIVDALDVTYVQPTAPVLTADDAVEYARKAMSTLIPKDTR